MKINTWYNIEGLPNHKLRADLALPGCRHGFLWFFPPAYYKRQLQPVSAGRECIPIGRLVETEPPIQFEEELT